MAISRFNNTRLIKTRNGLETYGLVEGLDVLKNLTGDQFTEYTVENGYAGRPDLIAFKFYGQVGYKFALTLSNRPREILSWPLVGDVIKIPDPDLVRSLV